MDSEFWDIDYQWVHPLCMLTHRAEKRLLTLPVAFKSINLKRTSRGTIILLQNEIDWIEFECLVDYPAILHE